MAALEPRRRVARRKSDTVGGLSMAHSSIGARASAQRDLAAAILAGGRARRLGGADKACFRSATRASSIASSRRCAPLRRAVFVVGAGRRRLVRARPHGRARRDPRHAGRSAASTRRSCDSPRDRTLVVACDMPFLSAALLGRWPRVDRRGRRRCPQGARGYEPLCAVYTRACLPDRSARASRRRAAGRGAARRTCASRSSAPTILAAMRRTGAVRERQHAA